MKNLLFILVFAPKLLFGQVEFEKRYGKGILEVNTTGDYSKFDFYKNPGDQNPIIQIEFRSYYDSSKSCHEYSYEKIIGADSIFVPELLHRSESCVPFQLNLAFVQEKKGFYQVIMNTSMKRKLVWLKKSDLIKELSFADYYKTMCSVEMVDTAMRVREVSSKYARIVFDQAVLGLQQNEYIVKCLAIKGYQMQVSITFTDLSKKSVTGWIYWRNNTDLLISYNLMCC